MKRFVPLFEEFNNQEMIHRMLVHLAHAIEETGAFGFVKVTDDNTIHVTDDYNFSDNDTYYIHDESVRIYGEYKIAFKPILTEDRDMIRLMDAGLTKLTDVITGFKWATEFELDSKDNSRFSHKEGDINDFGEDYVTWDDMGIEPGMDVDSIADTMKDWIKEAWYEYNHALDVQSILDEQFPEEDDDEEYDDEEEIDESAHHDQFIPWACEQLGIKKCPQIEYGHDHQFAVDNKSMAYFHPGEYRIFVLVGKRLKADWCRSLAHELTHAAQFERGENLDGSTGSPHENEANAMAGQLLRDYGKIDPSIYYITGESQAFR